MKLSVSLALVLVVSTLAFGQTIAKNSPPDLLARETSAPAASDGLNHGAQILETSSFLNIASTATPSTSAAEALLFTPVPKFSVEQPVFHKRLFISELAAYTAANVLDGITTVRGVRRGFTESSWPRGSAELLGTRPGIARYTATMGALELGAAFISYRLQHSQNRYLRLMGHSLMVEGTIDHTMGFASNLTLPSHPVTQ